jgi:predicted choloylglycine hydrolase
MLQKTFVATAEGRPGAAWQRQFQMAWPAVRSWYLKEGLAARPSPAAARAALASQMPELLPIYDLLCELAGPDEVAHSMLSSYDPPPIISGCSRAVWTGAGGGRRWSATMISRWPSPPAASSPRAGSGVE